MILRRIREHAGHHNWFAVAIDLLIVVLGVFLGTQVSNWNNDRLAHQAGDAYRARIADDLQTNIQDMQGRAAYYGQVRAFGLQALGEMDGTAPISDEQFVTAAYQATQIYPRPMTRAAYDEVLAAGAINTLDDAAIRQRISGYYVAMETSEVTFRNVPPYRDAVRAPFHTPCSSASAPPARRLWRTPPQAASPGCRFRRTAASTCPPPRSPAPPRACTTRQT